MVTRKAFRNTATALVVTALCTALALSAFAADTVINLNGGSQTGSFNDRGPRFEGKGNEMPCRGRKSMRGGFSEHMPMFAPDMPEEIRAIVVEVAKLKIDLHAEMSKKPIDKAKALEIFGKIQKAEQEVEVWKFGQRLERIEAFRKKMELNRNVPPAPKAEAPEVPAEKAE